MKRFGTNTKNDIWIAAIAKGKDRLIVARDKHLKDINFIATEEWLTSAT